VKGAEEKQVKYKQLSDMPNAIYGFAERFIETGDKKFLKEIEKEGYTIHYDNNGEVDYFTKEGKTFVTDPTKFSQYQLEGEKENYAEKLVILPNKEVNISEFVDANADYIIETYKKSGKLVVEC
jgi:deoxycytidine triphosphate deaminase